MGKEPGPVRADSSEGPGGWGPRGPGRAKAPLQIPPEAWGVTSAVFVCTHSLAALCKYGLCARQLYGKPG